MILQRSLIDQNDPAIENFYRQQAEQGMLFSAQITAAHYTRYPGFQDHWGSLLLMAACGRPESYYFNNRRVQVDNYSYLLIDRTTRYEYRFESNCPNRSIMVSFPTRLVQEFGRTELYDTDGDDTGVPASPPFSLVQGLHAHDDFVSPLLREMVQRLDTGCDETLWYEEKQRILLARLLMRHQVTFARIRQLPAAKNETKQSLARRIQRSVDVIHECYDRPLTLESLSREAFMSPYHFLRSFKYLHGVTPSQYLRRKRAEVSMHLLKHTDKPISGIAAEVGFADRSAFHRAFKRHAGLTPDEFRRSSD